MEQFANELGVEPGSFFFVIPMAKKLLILSLFMGFPEISSCRLIVNDNRFACPFEISDTVIAPDASTASILSECTEEPIARRDSDAVASVLTFFGCDALQPF